MTKLSSGFESEKLRQALRSEYCEMNIENWATHLMMDLDGNDEINRPIETTNYSTPEINNLISTQSYYRSKVFTTTISINQLIKAADPLLILITKLRKVGVIADAFTFQQHLCHEIKAFENNAQTSGYHSQVILAAHYALCALLDDVIEATAWGQECQWNKYSLLNYFHSENNTSEENDRFFLILERSLQDPSTHLDLLELFYLSLRFGYEGKYRTAERGHFILRNIIDNLYQCIRQYRDEFSKSLHIMLENPKYQQRKSFLTRLMPPLWVVSTMLGSFLLFTYFFFYMQLIKVSTPIEQFLTSELATNISQ